eukprot:TRINITY_DN39180_c0_g1_i1.p1 TRINITY_DN39180_c0_g1~~TRINITY_DN39180_c0_g1_i1.p1  ORF type:complete len:302 (-),score=68.12 TRINITY_DN39180_c0_g1_i1:89-994(-)
MSGRRNSPEFRDNDNNRASLEPREYARIQGDQAAYYDAEIPDYLRTTEGFGGDVPTTNLDLIISVLMALGMPFICRFLFFLCGNKAWAGLIFYYTCCTVVVRWRKGSLDFTRPFPRVNRKIVFLFLLGVLLAAGSAYKNYKTLTPRNEPVLLIVLTVVFWVLLNSALEQLSWLYVLDAWRNRWRFDHTYSFSASERIWKEWKHTLGNVMGIILYFVLIGLQHTMFWNLFLPVPAPASANNNSGSGSLAGTLVTVVLNLAVSSLYAVIYREHKAVWLLWILHFLADAQLVIIDKYSIFKDVI